MGRVQVSCEHIAVVFIFQRLAAYCKALIISLLFLIEQWKIEYSPFTLCKRGIDLSNMDYSQTENECFFSIL